MSFAIQRAGIGDYVARQPDTCVADPHEAYLFVSRQAAQQYIHERLPADVRWQIARFPTTRPLP